MTENMNFHSKNFVLEYFKLLPNLSHLYITYWYQDEIRVEQKESLQWQLQEDCQQPEAGELRNLLCEVAEVAEVEPHHLDDDDRHQDGHEDELVQVVQEVVLDIRHVSDV